MGPEDWKGERPANEKDERTGRREEQGQAEPRQAIDRREEEGYGQPESSAQKTPPRPEDEELGE